MNQLFSGISSYIQSWQHLLSLAVISIALIMLVTRHHGLSAVMGACMVLALLYTLPSLLPQLGL